MPFVGVLDEPVTLTSSAVGLNASMLGMLPLSDTFSLFAKVGFASYDIDTSVTGFGGDGVNSESSESESDMTYGAGGSMSFAQHFEARIAFDVFDTPDYDAHMISLSALYRF